MSSMTGTAFTTTGTLLSFVALLTFSGCGSRLQVCKLGPGAHDVEDGRLRLFLCDDAGEGQVGLAGRVSVVETGAKDGSTRWVHDVVEEGEGVYVCPPEVDRHRTLSLSVTDRNGLIHELVVSETPVHLRDFLTEPRSESTR